MPPPFTKSRKATGGKRGRSSTEHPGKASFDAVADHAAVDNDDEGQGVAAAVDERQPAADLDWDGLGASFGAAFGGGHKSRSTPLSTAKGDARRGEAKNGARAANAVATVEGGPAGDGTDNDDDDDFDGGIVDPTIDDMIHESRAAEHVVNTSLAPFVDRDAMTRTAVGRSKHGDDASDSSWLASSSFLSRASLTIPHNRNGVTSVAVSERLRMVAYGDREGVVGVCILPNRFFTTTAGGIRGSHQRTSTQPSSTSPTEAPSAPMNAVDRDTIKYLHPAHNGAVLSVAISDTSHVAPLTGGERTSADTSVKSFIVSSSYDGVIRVWRTEGFVHVGDLTAHRGPVTSIAFRLQTSILTSVSHDGCLRVWSIGDLAPLDKLFGHRGHIHAVATLARERCASGGGGPRSPVLENRRRYANGA